jgi:3-dehydroquinate synthase
MQSVKLSTSGKDHSYSISVGSGTIALVRELLGLDKYSSIFVVTDKNVQDPWLDKLLTALPSPVQSIVLEPGEQAKTIIHIEAIWNAMQASGCDRKSIVLTLGGGVIGDMGGFAASTFMRGVAFAHIPTTTLAQIDSSVGGKTGFNFGNTKNLIGTFSQPVGVLIDTDTLSTLPKREYLSGFAEMIKHGLIHDMEYLELLIEKPPLAYSPEELAALITTSNRIKAEIVESDETEGGERKILNFGHTVGHAIEAVSLTTSNPLLHGEAVSIGMVIEAAIAQSLGYITTKDVGYIERLLADAGLPVRIPNINTQAVFKKLRSDKKNVGGTVYYSLLESLGRANYNVTVDEKIVSELLINYTTLG